MALVSTSEIQRWVNGVDNVSTDVLTDSEAHARRWFELMTGRPLAAEAAHVVQMRGDGGHELVLPYPRSPGASITSVEERHGLGDSWIAVASSNFAVVEDTVRNTDILLRTDASWPHGEWSIRVTMPVGYDHTNCPEDLKSAVLTLIGFRLQGRFLTIDEVERNRRQVDLEVPWDVAQTVKRYRRRDWNQRMMRAL